MFSARSLFVKSLPPVCISPAEDESGIQTTAGGTALTCHENVVFTTLTYGKAIPKELQGILHYIRVV